VKEEEVAVALSFSVHGESDRNKAFCGDTISGTAVATIKGDGEASYAEVAASIVHQFE
jgi:hypothetical protein